jgi:hypothetical protein
MHASRVDVYSENVADKTRFESRYDAAAEIHVPVKIN